MELAYSELQTVIQDAALKARGKSIAKRRRRDLTKPATSWVAPARIDEKIGKAISIVLSTIGCAHARDTKGGCTMCSYLLDGTPESPTSEELIQQFQYAMNTIEDESEPLSVKIYTSGSFLDSDEIPSEVRTELYSILSKDSRVKQVVLESRPEYVTDAALREINTSLGSKKVELGIGFESSSNLIRLICINKGFKTQDFQEAVQRASKYNINVRAYVLLKPPFLTERDSLLDSIRTIKDLDEFGVSTISINPVTIQKNTLVERLWQKRKYRPPWLWTVVDVLKQARASIGRKTAILCDPVAAGKIRGAHNCGKCDISCISAIRDFSLNQDVGVFSDLHCDCHNQWQHVLIHEDASLNVHYE
jgi:radical SAM enzyme (TIGR01210 family)